MRLATRLFACCAFLLMVAPLTLAQPSNVTVVYVDVDATGANDGSSWADAFPSLQDALAAAGVDTEIWVAEGIYYPDRGATVTEDDVTASFMLVSGVPVFGGFTGTETARDERNPDPNANNTILSGDIDDDPNDGLIFKSWHVVRADGITGTVLNGFTIRDGGDEFLTANMEGIGILAEQSDQLFLVNLRVLDNVGKDHAGVSIIGPGKVTLDHVEVAGNDRDGLGIRNAEVRIVDSILRDNTGPGVRALAGSTLEVINSLVSGNIRSTGAGARGGGIFNANGSTLTVRGSTLAANDNTGGAGGGIFNDGSAVVVLSLFEGNEASNGGGFYNTSRATAIVVGDTFLGNSGSGGGVNNQADTGFELHNSYFLGNTSTSSGGAINNGGTIDAMNLVLAGNTATSFGGGLFNNGETTLRNATVYGNTAGSMGGATFNRPVSDLSLLNTVVWNNEAPTDPQIHFIRGQSTVAVGHSDVQGGLASGMSDLGDNLDAEPAFLDADGPDDQLGTLDDDFDLMPGSPLVDAGNNEYLLPDFLDLDGDGQLVGDLERWSREVGIPLVPRTRDEFVPNNTTFSYFGIHLLNETICLGDFAVMHIVTIPSYVSGTINWNDGSVSIIAFPDREVGHLYQSAGGYPVVVRTLNSEGESDIRGEAVGVVDPCDERPRQLPGPSGFGEPTVDIGAREALGLPVASEPDPSTESLRLDAPAPNPANGQAELVLHLASPEHVHLAVYDVLGREVTRLHDGPLAAGPHPFVFETRGLSAGGYLVRATGASFHRAQVLTVYR